MEKRCEFCKALRPVVFCKSDAAHLCLSCDAKVHSANALSYRHPRTLVCESCRLQPALVRCFDHQAFMCQSCDIGHHVSLDHHKKIISCYVGCPSAKDLAELWGLQFKDLDTSRMSCSTSRGIKVVNDGSQQKSSSYLIQQQILELERLQLSEGIDDSCLTQVKERPVGAPLDATWKEHSHLEHSDASLLNKNEEPLSSPFPQLDGESFWQYRSPVHNNEIWLQNMQDLGVCDEVECFDDVNIPDVDLTFRNFEELFSGEQDPRIEQSENQLQPMRPSHSVSSFSVSRITGDSSGSDNELFPTFPAKQRVSGGGETAALRYKEKKFAGHGQYTSARTNSGFKKRGKSLVWKAHEGDSGSF